MATLVRFSDRIDIVHSQTGETRGEWETGIEGVYGLDAADGDGVYLAIDGTGSYAARLDPADGTG